MASAASSSASMTTPGPSSTAQQESRPQAGPLPLKRGEIGYVEEIHGTPAEAASSPITEPLPARHPADRDPLPTSLQVTRSPSVSGNDSQTQPSSTSPPAETSAPISDDSSSVSTLGKSQQKRQRILRFFRLKKIPSYGGIRLTTFLLFLIQLLLLGATIAAWIFTIQALNRMKSSNDGVTPATSSAIFVHVCFAIAVLGQLLFLERRIFRLRAERYAFLHPGEMLPTHRQSRLPEASMGIAPWHRPPLPTYAAALAQSGVGTGDVEDVLIAAPPPPAYGNTRGSRLLLAGFLSPEQRAQRPASQMSQRSIPNERPVSYASVDDEWEIIQNADRALRLEETLSQLQRPASVSSRERTR